MIPVLLQNNNSHCIVRTPRYFPLPFLLYGGEPDFLPLSLPFQSLRAQACVRRHPERCVTLAERASFRASDRGGRGALLALLLCICLQSSPSSLYASLITEQSSSNFPSRSKICSQGPSIRRRHGDGARPRAPAAHASAPCRLVPCASPG
jgi:hypothetical protein